MKWKDLSLKERKQIYDSVRVNNPDATYLDIKQQFDSIPAYEDGKGKTINKADLPPEYRTGTPEYFERQRKISGKDRNSKKYQQEISRTIEQAIFPDERTRELVENVDKTYGTNYKRAYSNIAYKDMTKRGSYVKWGDTDKDGYGQINIKNIKDNVLPTDINDYNVILDNNIYMPGTANHELGHVADGLAGSRKIQDFDSGKEYITNTYLNYLANPNNAYSSAELRKMGLFDAAGSRSYLLNPTEAKSHMLTLKRSLKDSGKITNR